MTARQTPETRGDVLVQAARPFAQQLVDAVDRHNANAVAAVLRSLDTEMLYAVAVVLAANADAVVDAPRRATDVDPVVVFRLLGGDYTLAAEATRAERTEVIKAYQRAGGSLNELARDTGWDPDWYLRRRRYARPVPAREDAA